ncbi:C-type mannose receptor 2-like [Glandiceps talaboti]
MKGREEADGAWGSPQSGNCCITSVGFMPDGSLVGVGTDQQLYTKPGYAVGEWSGPVANSGKVVDVAVMDDGTLLGVQPPKMTLVSRDGLNGQWKLVSKGMGVVRADVMPDGLVTATKYKVFSEQLSQAEASTACHNRGMQLAVVDSAEVQQTLVDLLKSQGLDGNVWISLHRFGDAGFTTMNGKTLDYTNWDIDEPNGNGRCGYLRSVKDYRWDDVSCDLKFYYACEPVETYKVFDEQLSQSEASTACHNRGMQLAVVDSADVQAILVGLLKNQGLDGNVWISLHRFGDAGFTTMNGKALGYTNWDVDEPNGNGRCGYLRSVKDYRWDDVSCDLKFYYACEPVETYKVFDEQLSQSEASTACHNRGMQLAVVDSAEVQGILVGLLKNQGLDGNVWISLHRFDDAGFTTMNGKTLGYTNWDIDEPNGNGRCGYLRSVKDYRWDDVSCDLKFYYACEPVETYIVFDKQLSQSEASTACHNRGMQLAVVDSADVQAILVDLLKNQGLDGDVWISLHRFGDAGFTTMNGKALGYTNWDVDEPNGNGRCGYLRYVK